MHRATALPARFQAHELLGMGGEAIDWKLKFDEAVSISCLDRLEELPCWRKQPYQGLCL